MFQNHHPFAYRRALAGCCAIAGLWLVGTGTAPGQQTTQYECDLAVVGGGLGGVAAALEGLRAGHKVCLTEMTDWLGGQVSQQGVAALDEDTVQRREELFPRGYREFRALVRGRYGEPNPGRCWVSTLCFSPQTGALVLEKMLEPYRESGQLVLLKDTVVKTLDVEGAQVRAVVALTHVSKNPQRDANSLPLSHFIEDWYAPESSALFEKRQVRLVPPAAKRGGAASWVVIDATETGELLPLAGVPYRLGTERRTPWEPGASAAGADPYCTQSFTYSFAVEKTGARQSFPRPANYESPFNKPGYSYEKDTFTFGGIFTYRRIKSSLDLQSLPERLSENTLPLGEQSVLNWTWGNDWRLSTATDNLVLTQAQLESGGQLPTRTWWGGTSPGNWRGGLRPSALAAAEAHAFGFY
ncbi:MAG: FAD-dependent oxidoreductase, partial [Gemmatimonadaceae bacterium]|nr:FAD-dependent oxidoreductase [Gloeobacterales cyanobacterium ES-bin-141]